MNAVFNLLPSLGSQFNRIFHSEADRQEEISRRAKIVADELRASTDVRDLFEIADDMPGFLSTSAVMAMNLADQADDAAGLQALWRQERDAAILRLADMRAIRQVEELTPDQV